MDEEIQALLEQLSDPQYSARKVAARKLERLGLQAAPVLREALYSPNPILSIRAAQLLGAIGDTGAIPHLRELLGSDNVDIYGAAYEALRELARHQKSAEARDRILEELRVVRDNSPHTVRPSLLPSFISHKETTNVSRPSAPSSINQAQRRAALTLPETISGLIATLSHSDYQKRSAATNALVERGTEAVSALCTALEERSPVVRQRATEALGRIQDMDALVPLLSLLRREVENRDNAEASVLNALRDAILLVVKGAGMRPYTTLESIAIVRLVSHQAVLGLPYALFVGAANRLIALSDEAPSPELRSALPHLKGIWPFVPREFAEARKVIETATKAWADLPIASVEPTSEQQNLPRPVAETVMSSPPTSLPLPTVQAEPQKPAPLPTELNALIAALDNPDEAWCRRVEGALLVHGSEAVGPLQHAFVETRSAVHRARITGVLAGIGDVAGLPFLWVAWRNGLESQSHVSLRAAMLRMAPQLPSNHQRIALADLLMMLSETRETLPAIAEQVARALERRAQEAPTPELRRAIPLLKGNWLKAVPPVFDHARVAIEKATVQWADLPIASTQPATDAQDLPRSSAGTKATSPVNLPRPTEEKK